MRPDSYVAPEAPDKRVARSHALEIASRLASKVISYRAHTLGEPHFCYRVPFHTDRFWCTVYVSDTDYKLEMNRKRDTAGRSAFCAALKREWRIVGLKVERALPFISQELGIDAFTIDDLDEQRIARFLLAPPARTLLTHLEFSPVRAFSLNDRQIHFISELITPEHCAGQVRILRDLLLVLDHEARRETDEATT